MVWTKFVKSEFAAALTCAGGTLLFLAFVACSPSDKVSGVSTVETENAYLIKVVYEDSTPAVNVLARVRAANYLVDVHDTVDDYVEYITDSVGCFSVDSLASDSATVEIIDENRGAFSMLLAADMQKNDSSQIVMQRLGEMTGKVDLPEGESFAYVELYGTGRIVKTDSNGVYEIDSLAPATYLVHIVTSASETDDVAVVEEGPKMVSLIDFDSGTFRDNLKAPALEGTGYFARTDTSVVTTPLPDSALTGIEEAGAGRNGLAFHWTTSSPESGKWSFFGMWICHEDTPCDFGALDSIVYYVRGTGNYSFAMESMGDSNYQGKALYRDTLATPDEWTRVMIRPSDFVEGDSSWGNLGWDLIHDKITNISVSAYGEAEIWLDDIEFYGIDEADMK